MNLENKRVLITGGAGFIGSHIAEALTDCEVTVLDDLSKGKEENVPTGATFVKGSVTDFGLLSKLVGESQIVFHEAALNLVLSTKDPVCDLEVNAGGTLNLLEAARESGTLDALIIASSGSIYGEPQYNPQDENHPTVPTSQYGVSKLAADNYSLLYHKLYSLPITVLRYYNVYGPRQSYGDSGGVIPIFISRALRGEPLAIDGDGSQQRCFTHVKDVVRANLLAVEKKKWGEAYNIGTSESTTILQLADLVNGLSKNKAEHVFAPAREGDVMVFEPDISKAKKGLGYAPEISLNEGLPSVVDYMKGLE